jgi:hypothetical protein
MSIQSEMFNASIFVSEQLNRQMVNMVQDLAHRCVNECANKYGFDAEEAIRFLNLSTIKLERKAPIKGLKAKILRVQAPKAAFPLPYNGELNDSCCYALRQNNGLYTQCTSIRKGEAKFCKSCATTMQKTGAEVPEYGTIQERQAVGIFEFVDPKGRKPIAYTKVMKKYKISEEQVIAEAGKLNININSQHFVAPEEAIKRGRPSTQKEPKVKGTKGRPKKSKKVLQIEGDEEDLFASLVAQANEESEEESLPSEEKVSPKKKGKSEEEKEAERLAKEAEKAEKEVKRLKEKAEKEAKLAAEKAEKEAKKEAERLEREAKKKAEEEEKAAKKAALEEAKKAKETAKKVPKTNTKKVEEEDDEPDVVKKIEFEGKKFLKSKKTGIIYDYIEYTKNGEQVVVGKWNETSNKIEFSKSDEEEEEEEYDM